MAAQIPTGLQKSSIPGFYGSSSNKARKVSPESSSFAIRCTKGQRAAHLHCFMNEYVLWTASCKRAETTNSRDGRVSLCIWLTISLYVSRQGACHSGCGDDGYRRGAGQHHARYQEVCPGPTWPRRDPASIQVLPPGG